MYGGAGFSFRPDRSRSPILERVLGGSHGPSTGQHGPIQLVYVPRSYRDDLSTACRGGVGFSPAGPTCCHVRQGLTMSFGALEPENTVRWTANRRNHRLDSGMYNALGPDPGA